MAQQAARQHRWWRWIAIAGAVLISVLAVLWIMRTSLASHYARQWCKAQGLTCDFRITQLGFGQVDVDSLTVSGSPDTPTLTADAISVDLDWTGLFKPAAGRVAVSAPTITMQLDDDGLHLGDLQSWLTPAQPRTPAPALPDLSVEQGKLVVVTPAGTLNGAFTATTTPSGDAALSLSVAPTTLSQGERHLKLDAAQADVSREAGALQGTVNLQIAGFDFDQASGEDMALTATLKPGETPSLSWDAQIASLSAPNRVSALNAETRGEIAFKPGFANAGSNLWSEVTAISAQVTAGPSTWLDAKTQQLALDIRTTSTRADRLAITLDGVLERAGWQEIIGDNVSLSFNGAIDSTSQRILGDGNIVLTDVTVGDPMRGELLALAGLSAPNSAHAKALRQAIRSGLADFTTGGRFRLDAAGPTDWQIVFPDSIALQTASGLSTVLASRNAEPTLTVASHSAALAGVLTIKGGGFPHLDADITELVLYPQTQKVRTGGLTLHPWTAGELSLAAEFNRFEFDRNADQMRVTALGHLDVDGAALGLTLRESSLFGGVEAVHDSNGWRLQTSGRNCLGLDIGMARIGGDLQLQPGRLELCPDQGRILRQDARGLSGRVNLSDVSIPFEGRAVNGTFGLTTAEVDWTINQGLRLALSADTLSLPTRIGERTLLIDASTPQLSLKFGAQSTIEAVLSETVLGGDMVPANVTIETSRFNGRLSRNGFTATGDAAGVLITDTVDDPRYRPLKAALSAQFTGPNLTMSGPVTLAREGTKIADARVDMNLLSLNGTANVKTLDLQFTPRGLQPKTLTDRVRGILSNGRGRMKGEAAFTITGGQVAGTGDIEVSGFGFDSQRLGSVDGINGELHFADIISLTTAPSQTVTVGKMNPGIPLENGELVFQLQNGTKVLIERARWPLAGGELSLVTPASWTVAGASELYRIDARSIELSQLVAVLALPDIVAEGTVSGQFPIELKDGNTFIRDAHLAADEAGGTLQYTGSIGAASASADTRANAAFQALRDFRFKVLEIGLNGNLVGDMIVSMRLLGRNPDVYGGADFDFRIEVDSKLAQLIQSGRSAATTNWIAEAVSVDDEPETEDPFN